MSTRWILPLLALLCLLGAVWITTRGSELTPPSLLAQAKAELATKPPDRPRALRALSEALDRAQGDAWKDERATALRLRAEVYEKQGLLDLALADCRSHLAEFGPSADTLALSADLCLALGLRSAALDYATQLAPLDPGRGKTRIGRSHVALANEPLAALEGFARSFLTPTAAASGARLARRAAVHADDAVVGTAALDELLARFERGEERRRVAEWVHEAAQHMREARTSFVESLEPGSTGEAVAGLQDLLLYAGAEQEAVDLGLVALSLEKLEDPMAVLARTASALAAIGRLGTARALIIDFAQRRPAALEPAELTSLPLRDELREWCLLLERLALWDVLRPAAWELFDRGEDHRPSLELALYLVAVIDLATGKPGEAAKRLDPLGPQPLDQHEIPVRQWIARAASARQTGSKDQERYALLRATKAAPLDPPPSLRDDIGRVWERLSELQQAEGDLLAAEVSLTHALACSPARAGEVEPRWHELGRKSTATRGASSPYLRYARANYLYEQRQDASVLEDARALLAEYPGLGPVLELLSRAAHRMRDESLLISSSLELIERGWPSEGASARLRTVPRDSFLPQDRVRWLQLDPRGSLEDVIQRLLEKGDRHGAALAARGGPARYQPPALLPLLARLAYDDGEVALALETLALLAPGEEPFQSSTGLALRAALFRTGQEGGEGALAVTLAPVLGSDPEDTELLLAIDLLLAAGKGTEARQLLDWLLAASTPLSPSFLSEVLLRGAAERILAGETASTLEELERAAALVDDGRAELGRLIHALEIGDVERLAREAREALGRPLSASPAARAALLALSGELASARELVADSPRDGRDLARELVAAALSAELPPPFPERERALLLALAGEHPPWNAWVLARSTTPTDDEPLRHARRGAAYLAGGAGEFAARELSEPDASSDVRLAAQGVAVARLRGAPADVRAAEQRWFAAGGRTGDAAEDRALAAELAAESGARDEAVRLLEEGLELHPDAPRLVALLAALEDVPGRRARSIELFARFHALAPAGPEAGPELLQFLSVLEEARAADEISEARWWAEVEALEAEHPLDPAPVRALVARALAAPRERSEPAGVDALQRLERFRIRSFERPLESLRHGEAERWTELFARHSPEQAVSFTDRELLRDPVDPVLWRASARARLAAGDWRRALARLESLQRVAPDRETGRLLALTSFRTERDPLIFALRLKEILRLDPAASEDPLLAFYEGLSARRERDAAEKVERSIALWQERATNGLAASEHGRALAVRLYGVGRRDEALTVLSEAQGLRPGRLESDVLAALAYLMRAESGVPRLVNDAPLPAGRSWAFDDSPGERQGEDSGDAEAEEAAPSEDKPKGKPKDKEEKERPRRRAGGAQQAGKDASTEAAPAGGARGGAKRGGKEDGPEEEAGEKPR